MHQLIPKQMHFENSGPGQPRSQGWDATVPQCGIFNSMFFIIHCHTAVGWVVAGWMFGDNVIVPLFLDLASCGSGQDTSDQLCGGPYGAEWLELGESRHDGGNHTIP